MKARMTSARQAIFDELNKSHQHLKANEIHERLRERLPSLNLSTVYRSLDYLVEHGVISVSETPSHRLPGLQPNL
jgi:Fe2+ or Zn2+ uptake regulation protein